MSDRDRIREAFIKEFEALRTALEAALSEPRLASINRALENVREHNSSLDASGYYRAGYGLGLLDALQRLDLADELIDRVLERACSLPN